LIYDIKEPLTLNGPPAIGGICIVKLMPDGPELSPSEKQAE
jgi:hypothetical protein